MGQQILLISPYMFVDMFMQGEIHAKVVERALPKDVKFIRAFTNDTGGWGNIGLVLESQEWDELKEGDLIPVLPAPMFEKIYDS